ncbi:MAG: hypothetical protein ACRDV9_00960 [Acidimicrobiia bacterium]
MAAPFTLFVMTCPGGFEARHGELAVGLSPLRRTRLNWSGRPIDPRP